MTANHARWIRVCGECALLACLGGASGALAMRTPGIRKALVHAGLPERGPARLTGREFRMRGAPQTYVVLYTSPDCRFSAAAREFHRELFETARAAHLPFYVAARNAADRERYERTAEFAGAHFLLGADLPVEPSGTPTILLVAHGSVRQAWAGAQPEFVREEVLANVRAAGNAVDR